LSFGFLALPAPEKTPPPRGFVLPKRDAARSAFIHHSAFIQLHSENASPIYDECCAGRRAGAQRKHEFPGGRSQSQVEFLFFVLVRCAARVFLARGTIVHD
jgi:hypothetical protein